MKGLFLGYNFEKYLNTYLYNDKCFNAEPKVPM